MKIRCLSRVAAATLLSAVSIPSVQAQTSAFTYQGSLTDNGSPANGFFDITFSLWDAVSGPSQVGGTITNNAVAMVDGVFTVTLDFGPGVFDGSPRWLALAARTNGAGPYSDLTPRQRVTFTPYALFAASADAAQLTGTLPPESLDPSIGVWAEAGGDVYRASGKVGVGTTSPQAPLDVVGDVQSRGGVNAGFRVVNPNNAGATANLSWKNDVARIRVGGNGAGAQNGFDIQTVSDTSLLRIQGDGRVGIGTASPAAPLHVRTSSSEDCSLQLVSGGSWSLIMRQTPSSVFSIQNGGVQRFYILPNGKVGFGAIPTFGYVEIQQPEDTSEGGLSILNASQGRSIRVWADSSNNARIDSGGTGSASLLLNGSGSGRVGVGTTSPQARLHVAGDVQIDGTITIPTTTRYLSLNAAGFTTYGSIFVRPPGGDSFNAPVISWDLDSTASSSVHSYAMARLDLPHGATILGFTAAVTDHDPTADISVALRRSSAIGTGDGSTQLALVSTSLDPGTVSLSTTSILPGQEQVDNEFFVYYLLVQFPDSSQPDIYYRDFIKARISYTIQSLVP